MRIPDHPVVRALLRELGEPLVSSTLLLPDAEEPMTDGWQIKEQLDHVRAPTRGPTMPGWRWQPPAS